MPHDIVVCACGDVDHSIVFSRIEDDPEKLVYVTIRFETKSFWQRVVVAFSYIFKPLSSKNRLSSLIFDSSHVPKLEEVIKHLK